ncbi:Potassium transporter [Quillaja saponaria]|uniref:Potassium transporter n=1 Tax=Quillaja saponaria TaxID=32244 RepID=A0AAD7VGS4_QUISA|nr:Potassium transporter [Quillaja saponaria]KAJ7975277.1 Potassium transporter [Quillaja saponaria]
MDPGLSPHTISNEFKRKTWKQTFLLSFQIVGVVYGQLSTAPLYVFGTVQESDTFSEEVVYELFSFIFWTLTIISLLKYAFIVLRADDDGEGGVFALYSLLCRHAKVGLLPNDRSSNEVMHYEAESPFKIKVESRARRAIEKHKSSHYILLFLALFGSCMTIGDGVLTPALSVLSASSGVQRSLSAITHRFSSSDHTQESVSKALERLSYWEDYILSFQASTLPFHFLCMMYLSRQACAILVFLFMLQHFGTRKIGFMFAPVIVVWLLLIGGVGAYNIFHWNIEIIYKIDPIYMLRFVRSIDIKRWRLLGSIILCVAGSEAMFAHLGHFSKKSIKITFICLIYPLLVLCYAGQAAYMSKNLHDEHFNHLREAMPHQWRHLFVALSLFASAVGSQASITASFSIINQCLALGCFPRVKVIHTSKKIHGQVYIPDVNWLLMILSLTVTISFQDMVKIGNATGLAVISGMLVTTSLMSLIIALYWEKNLTVSACFLLCFGIFEAAYLSACLLNFHKGAWYLVVLLALSMTIMLAWHYGTMKKYEFDLHNRVPVEWLTDFSPSLGVSRVPGIGFIYTDIVTGIPAFFSHFITNLPAFHQVLIFVSFKSLPVPYVEASRRYLIGRIGPKDYRIYRCIVRYGYCDGIRDTDDFEEQIIRSIGEFITMEQNNVETTDSSEGRMVVVGKPLPVGNALVSLNDNDTYMGPGNLVDNEAQISPVGDSMETDKDCSPVMRKKVRFMLPANSPKMQASIREELQALVDARESGSAYFLDQSHLVVRDGSNFLKRFLIKIYVVCDKNSRQPPVALKIPHAALVEVGMVNTI